MRVRGLVGDPHYLAGLDLDPPASRFDGARSRNAVQHVLTDLARAPHPIIGPRGDLSRAHDRERGERPTGFGEIVQIFEENGVRGHARFIQSLRPICPLA